MRQFIFIILIPLLAGCTTVYVPTSLNAPMPEKKYDFTLSPKQSKYSLEFNSSLAVSDYTALLFNAAFLEKKNHDESFNSQLIEGAYGLFFPVNLRNTDYIWEMYLGYGNCKLDSYQINSDNHSYFDRVKGNYHKYFLQSDIGLKTKYLMVNIGARLVYLNLQPLSFPENSHHYPRSVLFAEPAITGELGTQSLKLVGQMGFCRHLYPEDVSNYEPFFYSLGISFRGNFLNK